MSKIGLENFVEYGALFEVYGKLLSADRQSIMESYFTFNMTLAEIATEKQISRQAVLDAIKKSCQKLQNFENALGVLKRNLKLSKNLKELEKMAKDNKEILKKVEEMKEGI